MDIDHKLLLAGQCMLMVQTDSEEKDIFMAWRKDGEGCNVDGVGGWVWMGWREVGKGVVDACKKGMNGEKINRFGKS